MQRKNNVLVTGAFGFIGKRLVEELLLDPRVGMVTALGRTVDWEWVGKIGGKTLSKTDQLRLKPVAMDARDLMPDAFPEVNQVYHLAAKKQTTASKSAEFILDENYDTDASVTYSFDRQDCKVLYLSTGEVHGALFENFKAAGVWPMTEGFPLSSAIVTDRSWLYSMSKVCGEMRMIHAGLSSRWSIVRLQNPYGPGMGDNTLIPTLLRAAMDPNFKPDVFVNDTRPFVFIDDVVKGLVMAMESTHADGRILTLTGEELSVGVLAGLVSARFAGGRELVNPKMKDALAPNHVRAMEVKGLREMGWRQWISIEEGLDRTYAYYKDKFKK